MSLRSTFQSSLNTLGFILNHPLNRGRKARAIARFAAWQVGARLVPGPVAVPFVGTSRLLVRRGMYGATGNIYTGLHELAQMAFVLHVLRPTDLFVDVGANVGSYTILAGAAVGCRSVAFEPIADSYRHLVDNVRLNDVSHHVTCVHAAVGSEAGELQMTTGLGPMNQVVLDGEGDTVVPVERLDNRDFGDAPRVIKIDVEGFETEVIAGGRDTLSDAKTMAVVMELNGSGDRYGYDEAAIHEEMLGWGYELVGYDPLTRSIVAPTGGDDTVVYIHDLERVHERLTSAPRYPVHGTDL